MRACYDPRKIVGVVGGNYGWVKQRFAFQNMGWLYSAQIWPLDGLWHFPVRFPAGFAQAVAWRILGGGERFDRLPLS